MKIQDGANGGPAGSRPLKPNSRLEAAATQSAVRRPSDQVSLTGRGAEVQRARDLALAAPEVRKPLVQALQGQVLRGEYRVSGAQVLPRLLREQWIETGA